MPDSTQLIQKYSFPYVDVRITDNSAPDDIDPVEISTEQIYPYTVVFRSGKGKDNVLIPIDKRSNLRKIFGKSNYKLYGQPYMLADALMSQSNVRLNAMRIMPDDAFPANDRLSIWYKEDVNNKRFYLKFTHNSLTPNPDITSWRDITNDLRKRGANTDGTPDENGTYVDSEGYTQVPAILFSSLGRGIYGNNYRWRISNNTDFEKAYGFKLYTFQCLNVENGTEIDATYVGSMVTSSKTTETSFINDVIEDSDDVNIPMDIYVYEENMEALYEVYKEFWKKVLKDDPTYKIDSNVYIDEIPDMDCFDVFFGKAIMGQRDRVAKSLPFIYYTQAKTSETDVTDTITIYRLTDGDYYDELGSYYTKDGDPVVENNITVEELAQKITDSEVTEDIIENKDYNTDEYSENENLVLINDITGNELTGGDDGSFPSEEAIDEMYIRAFSGSIDKLILSPKRMGSEALFDANFNMPVKAALAKLALFRNDCILYLDTNIMESLTEEDINFMQKDFSVIDALEEDFDVFANYLISYNLHHYRVKETDTGKRVPVTITNYLASIHPTHFRTQGYWIPMVGNYATLSGHIRNSLQPSVELHENDLKEILNQSRFNYFEATGDNTFVRATQNTSIPNSTDLLEENNVNTLMILKRNIENDIQSEKYNFSDPVTRELVADNIKTKYKSLKGKQLFDFTIKYTQNELEFNKRATHLYLGVKFRPLTKYIFVEINVNKLTYEDINS